MSDALRIEGSPARCPYCHEGLAGARPSELAGCAGCGARHHRECFTEQGACASCGCADALVAPTGGSPRQGLAEWQARLPADSRLTLERVGSAWQLSWPTLADPRATLAFSALSVLGSTLLTLALPGALKTLGLLLLALALLSALVFLDARRPSTLLFHEDELLLDRPGIKHFGGGKSVGRREHGWSLAQSSLLFRTAGQTPEIWLRKTGLLGAYLPGEDFDFVRGLIEAWRAGQLSLAAEPAREDLIQEQRDSGGQPLRRKGPLKA